MGSIALAQVLWQSPDMAPLAVLLFAALIVTVLWLYPPQTREAPALWRWLLPGLRGLALAALMVAVIRPAVLRPRTASSQGPLVLLADRSHSMNAVDRDRTPAEMVALSAGLNLLPEGARTESEPGLRARLDALGSLLEQVVRSRSEAEYARLSGRSVPAATARLRDAEARLRAALAELPSLPPGSNLSARITALRQPMPTVDEPSLRSLRQALNAAGSALAQAQAQSDETLFHDDPRVRGIAQSTGARSRRRLLEQWLSQSFALTAGVLPATPVIAFSFADDLRPLPGVGAGASLEVESGGAESDIAGALRSSLTRLASRSPQAIVLLSDGRQVGGEPEGIASDVAASGVPVFTVLTAAPGPRRDLSIVRVDAPASVRVGQSMRVHAELRGSGFAGATVDVRLDAGSIRQIKRVTVGDDALAGVDFDLALARPGPSALVVSVAPLPGESSDQNNRFVEWIKVASEPARVLVIAGPEAGRQYASLHAALSRSVWVLLREVEDDEMSSLSPGAIASQDAAILCDVPPNQLSEAQWTALERLWRDRGGSVIVCSGRRAPVEYASHPRASMLLPVEPARALVWRTWPGEDPRFRIVPSSALESPSSEMEFWRQLAPVSRYVPLSPLRPDARALLVERETGSAVLTETRPGLGRVYFIGTDQTWRWRGPGGGDERERFWPQMLRLAVAEPFVATEGNVCLDADPIAPQPDRPFVVRARVLDAFGQPVDASTQTLHLLKNGQPVRQVALGSVRDGSGLYRGTVSGLEAGEYVLRLDAPEDPSLEVPSDPVELELTVAPRLEREMANLSGDDQLLRRIAEASGGQFLALDELSALPSRLAANRHKQSALVEYTLWDSPYLFGFVLACLSAEWALRKGLGLA